MYRLNICARIITTLFIALFAGGCSGKGVLLQQHILAEASLSVKVIDEGMRLSTRHVSLKLQNLSTDTVVTNYEIHISSERKAGTPLLDIRFGASLDNIGGSGTTVTLRPGTTATVYLNTGLTHPIYDTDVVVRWLIDAAPLNVNGQLKV